MSKEPTYRDAIAFSWRIVWQYKNYWIFGFFALFLGQMGLVDFFSRILLVDHNLLTYVYATDGVTIVQLFATLISSLTLSASQWIWFVWLVLYIVAAGIMLIFCATCSQGALVYAIEKSTKKLPRKASTVSKAWTVGVTHFWSVFWLNVLRKIIILGLSLLVSFAAYSILISSSASQTFWAYGAMAIALLVGVWVFAMLIYAVCYVVIESKSFTGAIADAWELCKKHWLVSLEIGGIILLCQIIGALFISVMLLVFIAESAVLWALSLVIGSATVSLILGIFNAALLVVLIALFATILHIFSTALWTYLFTKMHNKGISSRILHTFGILK